MICLDVNIIIYAVQHSRIEELLLAQSGIAHPVLVEIEALGYHKIGLAEERAIRLFFKASKRLRMSDEIVELTIRIRQSRKVGLGDAVIAATAIENNCELWTNNTKDFAGIEDLKLVNPLEA